MADQNTITPSRRITLFGAAALASVAVSGSAKASPISPAVQRAFDDWQAAYARYQALELQNNAAHNRAYALLPDRVNWARPISAERQAAIKAALELSGAYETDKLADEASDVSQAAFLRFAGTPPQSMADVRLQAKHLSGWLEIMDVDVEQPVFNWLEVLTNGGVA